MIPRMWFARKSDSLFSQPAETPAPSVFAELSDAVSSDDPEANAVIKTLGWVSAALGAVALGLIVGRELRQRYKFNRRTPYDLYAHSGDRTSEIPDVEFGVGI